MTLAAASARMAAVVAMLSALGGGCGGADPGGGGGGAGTGTGGGGPGSAGVSGAAGGSAGTTAGGAGTGAGGAAAQLDGGAAGTGGGGTSGGGSDAGASSDGPGSVGDGASGSAAITQFLRIIQVTTVQGGTTVSISIDGQKNHNGTIHAGQALMMRIHIRPDTGWVAHPTVAELHLVDGATDVTLTSAPRTITGASTAGNLESTFNFDLTAAQVTKTLRFSVALRDPTGTPETPPPAVQRALYPRTGMLDTLDAQ